MKLVQHGLESGKFYFYVGRIGESLRVTLFKTGEGDGRRYFFSRHEQQEIRYGSPSFVHFELNEDEIMNHVVLTNI